VSARIRAGSRFKRFLCVVLIDVRCLRVPQVDDQCSKICTVILELKVHSMFLVDIGIDQWVERLAGRLGFDSLQSAQAVQWVVESRGNAAVPYACAYVSLCVLQCTRRQAGTVFQIRACVL
jgi:hypothetical protein